MQHIGDRIREYRMLHGFTQEGLAEKAGMHPNTIKKLEQGGTARMDTLHRIARALNTTTGSLISSRPRLLEHGDDGKLDLLDLRRTISPPITVDGDPLCDDTEPPDLPALKDALIRLDAAYHGDRYTDLAEVLPGLIRSTHTAVAHHTHTPREAEARRLRSVALQIAARYLTQVRAYDLAHLALADATRDAAASDDEMVSVSCVVGQAWVLIRQGRFDEAERLAALTADRVEPRLSTATVDHLSSWGYLLLRVSAAAARNNRPDVSAEALGLARVAAARIGRDRYHELRSWGAFGPLTVELRSIEAELVADRPDRVLEMAGRLPSESRLTSSDSWHRHRLDVAEAYARMRRDSEAIRVLAELRREAPTWLRHQRMARETLERVVRRRKRALTTEQRALIEILGRRPRLQSWG